MQPGSGIRRAGAIVAVAAALLVVGGALAPRWWVGRSGATGAIAMGVGIRRVELCGSLGCASRGLDDLGGGSRAWPRLGALAFATAWAAAALLVAAAMSVFARGSRSAAWRVRLGWTAALVSLFGFTIGAGFAWTYPGFEGLGAGWGLLAYLGGSALGAGSGGILIASRAPGPAPA